MATGLLRLGRWELTGGLRRYRASGTGTGASSPTHTSSPPQCGAYPPPGSVASRGCPSEGKQGLQANFTGSCFRKPSQERERGARGESPCRAPGGVSPAAGVAGTLADSLPRRPEAADPLVAGQVAAGPEAATCGAACRGPAAGNVGAGRRAATPTPRRPIHKTRRRCPGLAASSPNCKLIKAFASHLHGNNFLALNRETPPSFSPLCPALPIQ